MLHRICLALLLTTACNPPIDETTVRFTAAEQALRDRLGIPDDAERVLILGQNSHLDLGWERTVDEYYEGFVDKIYGDAMNEGLEDPDFRFATAEMGYLRKFVDAHPDRLPDLRTLNARGQFRLVGGGVSSPDVLIPTAESLLHDYEHGTGWIASVGLERTDSAYLPDSFGLGPGTPDVLAATGFRSVAFWRVDGNPDAPSFNVSVADFDPIVPAPGSNAETLLAKRQTDFLWKGPGGSTILGHWLTHGYMFGDYVNYDEIAFRTLGTHAGIPLEDPDAIAANIDTYEAIVGPLAPTGYRFVPIGGDFQFPKDGLGEWVRHYNATRFPETGLYVVSATFDDYADLVWEHADELETFEADLTPYWMGFWASRADLKRYSREGASRLTQAEALSILAEPAGYAPEHAALDAAWWTVGLSNHHDWVTGTSVPYVYEDEQLPQSRHMFEEATRIRDAAMAALAGGVNAAGGVVAVNLTGSVRSGVVEVTGGVPESAQGVLNGQIRSDRSGFWLRAPNVPAAGWTTVPVTWTETSGDPGISLACDPDCAAPTTLTLTTPTWSARIDALGDLASWKVGGIELLAAPTSVIDVADGGGLYTFGHESSCAFAELPPLAYATDLAIVEHGPLRTVVESIAENESETIVRRLTFHEDTPDIDLELVLGAPAGVTRSLDLPFALPMTTARMAVPGGVVERDPGSRFDPEFVPFERWFRAGTSQGWSVFAATPSSSAASFDTTGATRIVVHREDGAASCDDLEPERTARAPVTVQVRLAARQNADDATGYGAVAPLWHPLLARWGGTGALPATHSAFTVQGPAVLSAWERRGTTTRIRLQRLDASDVALIGANGQSQPVAFTGTYATVTAAE